MQIKGRCKFSKDCAIYHGVESIAMDLMIYRNVFCNRGPKGWNNCKKYIERINIEESK